MESPTYGSATYAYSTTPSRRHSTLDQSYAERSESDSLPPLATYLLRLIHLKRTNLCVSADVKTSAELLQVADDVGDHICVLKTHADIVADFSDKTARRLTDIARRRKFIIFEDRKFCDIGNTVQEQYTGGLCCIAKWAHLVNAQLFSGPSIVTALSEAARKAVAAHNTSVQTDISASPAPSVVDSGNDNESGDSEDEDDDEEYDDDDEPNAEESRARRRHDEVDDRTTEEERLPRKHSVVSVSTTISTKTETLSPQPRLRPSLSRGSTEEEEQDSEVDDHEALLEELGPPPYQRSLLLLAQMSSKDNLFTPEYTSACVAQARQHRDFVVGFIAQQSLNTEPGDNFITMTPGVQLAAGGDALGQQYNTPRRVLVEAGSDVIIVGRGILMAKDRRRAALDYRKQGWLAYEERLHARRRR